ncbi:MAG TPA: 3,4-dihydroxy-2-butanone-4-phosphate synthase [Candidatus Thermoplasmatota archaeon]|nr:3,4-dihydroxy-2-butanone-4-phosphate synthase [Candidatus Thermoplasmatota archaeon]
MSSVLDVAARHLRDGKFVCVYDADGREEEVDLFVAAEHATPAAVRTLRKDAGGLVFLAVDPRVGRALDLPFLQDLYAEDSARHPVLQRLIPNDIKYDTRSSFSLTINHRKTFTGITDNDRSLTIQEFAKLAKAPDVEAFGQQFRAPGHVHLCVGADKLLHERQGHTEIGVALARLSGVVPVLAGCEMLADNGRALSKADAQRWADAHEALLLDGKAVEAAWMKLEATAAPSR